MTTELTKDHKSTTAVVNSEAMELSAGFIRQRRNLFMSSAVLILLAFTDAQLGDTLNLVFVTIKLHNTRAFEFIPMLVCAYAFWRYEQYLYQEERVSFWNVYTKYFQRYTNNIFKEILDDLIRKENPQVKIESIYTTGFSITPLVLNLAKVQCSYYKYNEEASREEITHFKLHFYQRLLYTKCTGYYSDDKKYVELKESSIYKDSRPIYVHKVINLFCYPWKHLRSLCEATFSTSYFTDYYLPRVLGAVALVSYFLHLVCV